MNIKFILAVLIAILIGGGCGSKSTALNIHLLHAEDNDERRHFSYERFGIDGYLSIEADLEISSIRGVRHDPGPRPGLGDLFSDKKDSPALILELKPEDADTLRKLLEDYPDSRVVVMRGRTLISIPMIIDLKHLDKLKLSPLWNVDPDTLYKDLERMTSPPQ